MQPAEPANNRTLRYIISFTSAAVRDVFINKKRSQKTIKLTEIFGDNTDGNLYPNEFLRAFTYNLLRETKILAAEKLYKFVWVKKRRIFVRKDNGHECFNIVSESDLSNLTIALISPRQT